MMRLKKGFWIFKGMRSHNTSSRERSVSGPLNHKWRLYIPEGFEDKF